MPPPRKNGRKTIRAQQRVSAVDKSQGGEIVSLGEILSPNASEVMSQAEIIERLTTFNLKICRQRGWPEKHAERIAIQQARVLLGPDFETSASVPEVPPVPFGCVPGEPDDPIEFLDKHWARHLDEGVIDKCKLEMLDPRLFSALKWWAQKRKLSLRCAFNPQERPRAVFVGTLPLPVSEKQASDRKPAEIQSGLPTRGGARWRSKTANRKPNPYGLDQPAVVSGRP